MTVRVGIHGFGRIGRTYPRAALDRAESGTQDVHVVAYDNEWGYTNRLPSDRRGRTAQPPRRGPGGQGARKGRSAPVAQVRPGLCAFPTRRRMKGQGTRLRTRRAGRPMRSARQPDKLDG